MAQPWGPMATDLVIRSAVSDVVAKALCHQFCSFLLQLPAFAVRQPEGVVRDAFVICCENGILHNQLQAVEHPCHDTDLQVCILLE